MDAQEPLFDAVDTVTDTLRIFADMIPGITARPENLRDALRQGFATATDLAETTDVAQDHPEIAAKMPALMQAEHVPNEHYDWLPGKEKPKKKPTK